MKWLLGVLLFGLLNCGIEKVDAQTTTPSANKSMFVVIKGRLSKGAATNKESQCEIKQSHPELKDKVQAMQDLLAKANKEPLNTAYHFTAQIPSVEIYGYLGEGKDAEKVLLVEDHSALKSRQGPASEKLLEFIKKVCP
ncbi:MAG: hypothetical protein AB7T49_12395 [Oligoflexales bacterium]